MRTVPPRSARGSRRSCGGTDDAAIASERLAEFLGLAGATASPEETHWAIRKLFEALAAERPLVAVFEDIHWAEPGLLDLIEHVAEWTRDAPILLVCTARPELQDVRPGWGAQAGATTLLLEPLSAGGIRPADRRTARPFGHARGREDPGDGGGRGQPPLRRADDRDADRRRPRPTGGGRVGRHRRPVEPDRAADDRRTAPGEAGSALARGTAGDRARLRRGPRLPLGKRHRALERSRPGRRRPAPDVVASPRPDRAGAGAVRWERGVPDSATR